eukprot:7309830-Prymnesium_polylepis.1
MASRGLRGHAAGKRSEGCSRELRVRGENSMETDHLHGTQFQVAARGLGWLTHCVFRRRRCESRWPAASR